MREKQGTREFRSEEAEHLVLNNHIILKENMALVKHIGDERKLDVAASFEIYRTQNGLRTIAVSIPWE